MSTASQYNESIQSCDQVICGHLGRLDTLREARKLDTLREVRKLDTLREARKLSTLREAPYQHRKFHTKLLYSHQSYSRYIGCVAQY